MHADVYRYTPKNELHSTHKYGQLTRPPTISVLPKGSHETHQKAVEGALTPTYGLYCEAICGGALCHRTTW